MANSFRIPFGAWRGNESISISFPDKWEIMMAEPEDASGLTSDQLERYIDDPIECDSIEKLAFGKKTVAIAVDDITRPTPTREILPLVLEKLKKAGIDQKNIKIIIASGAHKPMNEAEMAQKLSRQVYESFECIVHDFMGDDNRFLGWIEGGPVFLNKNFLDADLKLCVGGVMPHGETGFGGASKLIVPGIAGYMSIAYLHGALPPRPVGEMDGSKDRREWIEKVALYIGVDAVICSVVNTKREIAGIFFGDLVQAHRKACQLASRVGKTTLTRQMIENVDVLILNTYPLDTDPVQMGKVLRMSGKVKARDVVLINSASDGIFYHGMGMGSWICWRRLFSNFPFWFCSPLRIIILFKVILKNIKRPALIARYCYFAFNNMHYSKYEKYKKWLNKKKLCLPKKQELYVYSPNFPYWGLRTRYPDAVLYNNWNELTAKLQEQYPGKAKVLIFPCTPLQLISNRTDG
jgi:nickel-dependent lactate racemase